MATKAKAARTTAKKAGKAASTARDNPYVQRLIEDPELREHVRGAVEAARSAYKRMSNGKAPTRALVEDKKLQRDLREAADELRVASDQIRGKRTRRKKHRGRRLVMLMLIGGAAALIFSEGARKAVLDRLFGAEEEFEYTSTTTPA